MSTMIDDIQMIRSTRRGLRKLGIISAAGLLLLAALLLWRGSIYCWPTLGLSALMLFAGLFLPSILIPLHKVVMTVFILLMWFLGAIVLAAVFGLVLVPIALIMRLPALIKRLKDHQGVEINREDDLHENSFLERHGFQDR